ALLALMCFQASRLNARKNEWGDIVLYADQDESQWNQPLLARGIQLLHLSSGGQRLSPYHLEASIAYWHTQKADSLEKWERILTLYQQLLQLSYTAVAALNSTYAFFKVRSFLAGEKIARQEALGAAEALPLKGNPFYHALLAELYTGIDHHAAIDHLKRAIASTKSNAEKNLLAGKLAALQTNAALN
ncbi:MAG TPA: DUF6596 domain-containing protein, partial [Chitinophagaceae bacterium]|nr:DUF6596 domain-containing protein [Chitinophagaceae bacterium]